MPPTDRRMDNLTKHNPSLAELGTQPSCFPELSAQDNTSAGALDAASQPIPTYAGTPITDFDVIRDRICLAAQAMAVPSDIAEFIAQPRRTIEMNLAIMMDDGTRKVFPAWRVQHSSTRALQGMKGGFKITPDTSRESVTALAAGMTIKTAVAGLPLGGAKGGIRADIHNLSPAENERLIRRYASEIAPDLGRPGHWIDVPAPDMGTDSNAMAIFADTISRLHGGFTPGVVTGKPIALGGIPGRVEATGFGVAHLTDLISPLANSPVAISGFGNVGSHAALTAQERGARVVAIFDPYLGGVLTNPQGIAVRDLAALIETGGRSATVFEDFATQDVSTVAHNGTFADALHHAGRVHVFMPCGAPQSVDSDVAALMIEHGVRIVAEGANSPLTPVAARVLGDSHVVVVPDVLANAGGVVCSYLEMSKAAGMTLPTRDETLTAVGGVLSDSLAKIRSVADKLKTSDLRLAADACAVREISDVHQARGVF